MAVFIGSISRAKKGCLTKEFRKLKKKRSMAQKQKVAIALNVCKIPRKKPSVMGAIDNAHSKVGGYLMLSPANNDNSPSYVELTIVKETEKAIQVQNEVGVTRWLPKSALVRSRITMAHNIPDYHFAPWFTGENKSKVMQLFKSVRK